MSLIKILYLILTLSILSCSGLKDAGQIIRNEKVKSTDEFLIKKREALTQPPDFDKIPEPDTLEKKSTNKDEIKSILKVKDSGNKNKKVFSSTEKSILNQIKK